MQSSLISAGELMVIEEQRKTDKKLKKKEEEYKRLFYRFVTEKEIKSTVKLDKNTREPSKIQGHSLQIVDKLKIFQKQNKMLFSFCHQFLDYIEK